jgi:ethanolamine ammonia-lyase small subunit
MNDPRQEAHSASPAPIVPTLHSLTTARVALARAGTSIATAPALAFSLAHAQARDAVHSALDVSGLLAALRDRNLPATAVESAATTRAEYLRRPDLGRTLPPGCPILATASSSQGGVSFAEANDPRSPEPPTTGKQQAATVLSLILADGLSATAANRHAIPLLDALLPLLNLEGPSPIWRLTRIVIAIQARVALADPIGHALGADVSLMLIGERPGLSSPDSLGAYLTWAPRPGRTDAERNCVSNIRAHAGLDYDTAARKIAALLHEARRLGFTGVHLREPDMVPISEPAHRDRLE